MLQSGQRLDDYRIVNFFAGGGMGEIYLAEEVSLGRQVAIKVIRPEAIRYPDSADGRKVIQLFRREATAIAKLNHPYILPLYRFGEATLNSDPLMYMVMPYCQEKSFPDWMYAHGKKIFSPQEVDYILQQAAEALQHAHDQGIMHLDVKPSNFLVRYQTDDVSRLYLQLMDFGVAKVTATSGIPTQMTLDITQQNQQRFEGTCTTVDSLFGTTTFTLEHNTVDRSGNIQFALTGTNLAAITMITFIGTSQSGGGWKGTFSDTNGNQGTWSVS